MTTARRTLDLAMTEAQWQTVVLDLARTLGWMTYHTHDSRRSNPGFPDLVLVRDRVIFAELKTERGKLTDDQWSWLATLRAAGAEMWVWRPSDYPSVERILRGEP
jgi:hypothetical protein